MMKIGVTGATGFLGRYLVNRLLKAGHTCRCWYRPGSDRGEFLDAPDRLQWLPGKLCDDQAATALVQGVDAVVHAALSSGDSATGNAQHNLAGSLQLMQAARTGGVERFVFISSCSVHEKILDDRALDETHPLWPSSHYGAAKASVEKFVHSFALGEGWPVCALRPTGIYGLARPVERSSWYSLVQRVAAGNDVASAAGGKVVHAEDVAKAVLILLEADPKVICGQAYNCNDLYIADQDVAQIAKDLCAATGQVEKNNHGPKHQIDTTKIKSLGMVFGGQALLEQTVGQLITQDQRDHH